MDAHVLPHYPEMPDSLKGWSEPDGSGRRPSFRLRDYVMLAVLFGVIGMLLFFPVTALRIHMGYQTVLNQIKITILLEPIFKLPPKDSDANKVTLTP